MDKKLIYGSATTYSERTYITVTRFNPLIHTLKSQSNGPLYSDTVIGRRAVDGWAGKCNIWYSEEGPGRGGGGGGGGGGVRPRPVPSSLYQSTASVPASYYLMWHYNCLSTPKG